MSYGNGYKGELGDKEPAGSLAPMSSTMDGSKWHHNVGALEISKLTKISAEINNIVDETTTTVAKAQIKVGRLLNEARAMIPGDLQFGKWREQNTNINNKSTANKLMNLAKQVGEGRITQEVLNALPMSTLKELISAPDSVVDYVNKLVAADEPVTREEVRELVRGEKEPEFEPVDDDPKEITGREGMPAEERKTKAPAAPLAPPRAPAVNVRDVCEVMINKPLLERLRALDPTKQPPYPGCKPIEWAWLVMGLDTDPAILPNQNVISILAEAYIDTADSEDMIKTINRAVEIIDSER